MNPVVNKEPMKVWEVDEDLFLEAMNSGKLSNPNTMIELERLTKERKENGY